MRILLGLIFSLMSANEFGLAAEKLPTKPAPKETTLVRRAVDLPKHGAGSTVGKCDPKANRCAADQECVLIEVHCVAAPCPPIQECVAK